MSAAVAALSWELLRPHRWLLSLMALALVLFCVVSLLLPEGARSPAVGAILALSLAIPLTPILGLLSYGDQGRLESSASSFPARLFTLPVPTSVLVGPPLLLGTVIVLVCWLSCAACLLRPYGIDVPLFWPGFLAAAGLALLQAFIWHPLPLPWLRLVVLALSVPILSAAVASLIVLEVSEPLLVGMALILLLTGYAGAATGVRKARRGVGVHEPVFVGQVAVPATLQAPRRFTSPLRALLWLEWRMRGWPFIAGAACCLWFLLPAMIFFDKVLAASLPPDLAWLEQARETVSPPWLVMTCLLYAPIFISQLGIDLGLMTGGGGTYGFAPFRARQPVHTMDLLKAKLLLSGVIVLGVWAVVLLQAVVWAVWMGRIGALADQLVAWTGSGPAALGVLLGGILLLIVVTWLWLSQNLWAGALGRFGAMILAMILNWGSWGMAIWLAVNWREEWFPLLALAVSAALPAKALAVFWVVRRLLRRRLIDTRSLTCVIASWVLLAAVAASVVVRLTSGGALVAGAAVLVLPLARPLAAPLALAFARSR